MKGKNQVAHNEVSSKALFTSSISIITNKVKQA